MLTREEAEAEVQRRLVQLQRDFDEIKAISDEWKIEFSFLGGTMHYHDYYRFMRTEGRLAKDGFFVADNEWESSGIGCHNDDFGAWRTRNWPEDYE